MNTFDYLLSLAEKSCPETVVRQGNLRLWEANRDFVMAGVRFVKLLAKEAAISPQHYSDLTAVAHTLYQGLVDCEEAVVSEIITGSSSFDGLITVGEEVTKTLTPSVDALLAFDEIDRYHQEARRNQAKWRQN